jgi:hypothetical protein
MGEERLGSVVGLTLPPREVVPPKSSGKSLLKIFVPVAVVVVIGVLVLNHRSSGVIGVIVALAIFGLIIGIELPLILRGQRNRIERDMSTLPVGAFYKGRAEMFPVKGERRFPATGTLILDSSGVSWTKRNESRAAFAISWDRVNRIRLGPQPGKLGSVGTLRLDLTDQATRAFTIPSYGTLACILQAQG